MDNRIIKLAKNIVSHSISVKPNEKVLIEIIDSNCNPLANELVRQVYELGGFPYVDIKNSRIQRELMMQCCEEQMDLYVENKVSFYKHLDSFILLKSQENSEEFSDVPLEKSILYNKKISETYQVLGTKKWTYLNYPNASLAQSAKMSLKRFEDFYFNICTLNYKKMSLAMNHLVKLIEKTDRVHIVGNNTDLTFSINNMKAIKCDGRKNLPDGEVFTAPIKTSINGKIIYNVPSSYNGFTFDNVCFKFENGKIVKATANNTERLNKILDIDDGARYIGEFAFGVNPYITKPMNNILYDEKISGSFHLTPGKSYEAVPNGNNSSIHWDLVCIQTPEYGGGEIYFDDVLIRKDGLFVLDELVNLNPENLI